MQGAAGNGHYEGGLPREPAGFVPGVDAPREPH